MALPLPQSNGLAFQEGANSGSELINRLMQQIARQKELEETAKYHQGSMDLDRNKYGLEREKFGLEKQQQPLRLDLLKAQAEAQRALAGNRSLGGSGMGTGGKEELFFQSLVDKDNPQFGGDKQKVYQAANRLRQGETTLEDGTPINPLSPASRASFDRITKSGSTSGQVNQMLNAKGADEEIKTLSNLATQWNKPYGNTYLNKSPQQIVDTFKNDEVSQTRLGEFIAAQQLQNEIAQIETRLAMGQPGITNTHDLMKLGAQQIDARYPILSQKAREVAQKRFVYALQQGLKAREKIGIGASGAVSNPAPSAAGNKNNTSNVKSKSLDQWAQEAIQNGADPQAVAAKLAQLKGGG